MRLEIWKRLFAATLTICAVTAAAATGPAMAAPPANDNFANSTTLAGTTSVAIPAQSNVEATTEGSAEDTCCFIGHTVWFNWTAPKTGNYRLETCASNFNTYAKVYKGDALATLDDVKSNNNDGGCTPNADRARLEFIAFAGQRYEIQLGGSDAASGTSLQGSLSLVSPANDFFADSQGLTGTSTAIGGSNVDATNETGEDTCCFRDKTVWFNWTAPKTGNYRIDLCGSSFNTDLKVWKGGGLTTLERVADNADDPGCGPDGSRSRLTFIAFLGQRYDIQIGSKADTAAGTISGSLALVSPPNDFFADAAPLTGATVAIGGTNVDASTEAGEDTCCFTAATVWYRWTAPSAGSYTIDTCGSTFNTYLKVYKGPAITTLEKVAENDDAATCSAAPDRSAATFTAAANTVYFIQIGSAKDPRGTIAGSIKPGAGPALFPVGTITPGATSGPVTLPGGTDVISLSGPKTCVLPGQTFSATLSHKAKKKKGRKKVKITKVEFSIDGKLKKTDRKAPFKQTLTSRSYVPGSLHTLKARAFIKVKKGKKVPKKSVSAKFRVCSV
jgi:hypothetical protein